MRLVETLFRCVVFFLHGKHFGATETFIVSFQPSLKGSLHPSTDHWIEYLKPIHPSKEFTACNWMKVKYFGRDIAIVLWSYCTKATINSSMNCTQIFLRNNKETANRHLEANGYLPWSRYTHTMAASEIRPYMHRTWFHFCWSFRRIPQFKLQNINSSKTRKYVYFQEFQPLIAPAFMWTVETRTDNTGHTPRVLLERLTVEILENRHICLLYRWIS